MTMQLLHLNTLRIVVTVGVLLGLTSSCSIHLRSSQFPNAQAPSRSSDVDRGSESNLKAELELLGPGIEFRDELTTTATAPRFVYSRAYSVNSRVSPVGIVVWVFDRANQPIHKSHIKLITEIYDTLYRWNPVEWSRKLTSSPKRGEILRAKSDIFWESLQQQMAERILEDYVSPPYLLFGPECAEQKVDSKCQKTGIANAHRVVIRTFLDAAQDPLNPVTRTITYDVTRTKLKMPRVVLELEVPNGIEVNSSHKEYLDFRPEIAGRKDRFTSIRLFAELPSGRRARYQSHHYPDYNLLFVPLRHLLFQGEVANPRTLGPTKRYKNISDLKSAFIAVVSSMRERDSSQLVVTELTSFITDKYYYMFGDNLTAYRSYILSSSIGIGKGLNPDFDRIELWGDDTLIAVSH